MSVSALATALTVLNACSPAPEKTPEAQANTGAVSSRDYLYTWTASADTTQPDFLAVLDVTEPASDTGTYGSLVTTLPVPGVRNGPHHTDHELAADRQLFANGFGSGKTWVFDLSTPDKPRIAAEFGDMDGYMHPHSFLRLANGNVLATFQMKHSGSGVRPGGLVELTPAGALVSSSSADYAGADTGLRVYSAALVPSLDRIVSTSTDMEQDFVEPSRTLEVWRLSDRKLLSQVVLPGPNGVLSAEPRVLGDGRTVLVSTFTCGLFIVDGLDGTAPTATQVASFPRKDKTYCAIPVIAGNFYLVTVPAYNGVVSLDISNPRAPKEVSRVSFDSTDVPHWISISPDHKRVVVTGYASMKHQVQMLRFDATTGKLSRDERFREPSAVKSGFDMSNKQWPHGGSAMGVPHGAVFSRP